MSNVRTFWSHQKEHSRIKSEIVVKYFSAWAAIMKRHCDDLTYLDLFSGRGMYNDGEPSTPVLLLNQVENDLDLQKKLHMHFYESDLESSALLSGVISNHPATTKLRFQPLVHTEVVDRRLIPTLPIEEGTFCFIDPHGYKGVSMELLHIVTRDWGCDSVFYLSMNGVQRNLQDERQYASFEQLFGKSGLISVRKAMADHACGRPFETAVLTVLKQAVARQGVSFFLPYRIETERRKRTSHYLIFISKHWRGFKIMKEVMGKFGSDSDGIPTYEFSYFGRGQECLPLHLSLNKVAGILRRRYAGKSITIGQICDDLHQSGCVYLDRNIKDALNMLETQGAVVIDIPMEQRPIRDGNPTLGNQRAATFR